MDIAFWHQIKQNNYAFPVGHQLTDLTEELFSYLASSDPELRLEIANAILEQWISVRNLYSDAQLDTMIDELLDNLRNGIGESGTDSIFLRSISLWILAYIVRHDSQVSFMSVSRFNALFIYIEQYARDEQDLRGWVDDKGWAHSTAHIASLLVAISEHPHANQSIDERILSLVSLLATRQTDYIYHHGEDDRMADSVMTVLSKNNVSIAFLRNWLKQLESVMALASEGMSFDIRIYNAYMNARNFVRAVYFPIELCLPEKPPLWDELRPMLLDSIKEIGLC